MYAVEMRKICKRFKNVTANDSVDLRIRKGEIHSLLGENGAGKTTLMNILYGIYREDSGEILIDGKPVKIDNPLLATQHGIAMVHQHFMLVDNLTVAENVVLGNEPRHGIFFDAKEAFASVDSISRQYGLAVDARRPVGDLSVGTKQRVEIIKALYRNANIMILDEPTAVLTPQEVHELFQVLRALREMGKTIILITHKLRETLELADTVTVLRQGKNVETLSAKEATTDLLAKLMVGRIVSFDTPRRPAGEDPAVIMEIRHATVKAHGKCGLNDVSFQLHAGEILGIAGVEGNGQTELIEAVTGIRRLDGGQVLLHGEPVANATPGKLLRSGVGHIPEDRGKRGFVKEFSIRENLILGYHRLKAFCSHGFLKDSALTAYANTVIRDFDVRGGDAATQMSSLSGGNQQKLIVARALLCNPDVIVAAQPTRGIDIGAIEYIHRKLIEMRNSGKAILLISAELDEIVRLSDRIAVIYEGRIVANRPTGEFDEMTLGALMTNRNQAGMGETS